MEQRLATETVLKCIFPEVCLLWYLSNEDWYRRFLWWQSTRYEGEQHIQISFWSNRGSWSYSFWNFCHQYVFSLSPKFPCSFFSLLFLVDFYLKTLFLTQFLSSSLPFLLFLSQALFFSLFFLPFFCPVVV